LRGWRYGTIQADKCAQRIVNYILAAYFDLVRRRIFVYEKAGSSVIVYILKSSSYSRGNRIFEKIFKSRWTLVAFFGNNSRCSTYVSSNHAVRLSWPGVTFFFRVIFSFFGFIQNLSHYSIPNMGGPRYSGNRPAHFRVIVIANP